MKFLIVPSLQIISVRSRMFATVNLFNKHFEFFMQRTMTLMNMIQSSLYVRNDEWGNRRKPKTTNGSLLYSTQFLTIPPDQKNVPLQYYIL